LFRDVAAAQALVVVVLAARLVRRSGTDSVAGKLFFVILLAFLHFWRNKKSR
jgi:hypothetical protein